MSDHKKRLEEIIFHLGRAKDHLDIALGAAGEWAKEHHHEDGKLMPPADQAASFYHWISLGGIAYIASLDGETWKFMGDPDPHSARNLHLAGWVYVSPVFK